MRTDVYKGKQVELLLMKVVSWLTSEVSNLTLSGFQY